MGFLSGVRVWAPFKIDALGIVTLLGANSLQKAAGRLVSSPYVEYLPQLGAYVFADNSFAETMGGFTLYNITDGIVATDLSPWFTRWLLCQDITRTSTTLHISADLSGRGSSARTYVYSSFAILLNSFLVAFAIAIADWYGLAAVAGLVFTILGRSVVLSAWRASLDTRAAREAQTALQAMKLFITMPNGKVVSVRTTRGITKECLLMADGPEKQWVYRAARAVIWVAFAVHAVCLGMASLSVQLIIVAATLIPTVLAVRQMGCDESRVGRVLRLIQEDDESVTSRSRIYLKMELVAEEEVSMISWHLLPQRSNHAWWIRYRALQQEAQTLNAAAADPKQNGARIQLEIGSSDSTSSGPQKAENEHS